MTRVARDNFWDSEFGQEYTKRNHMDDLELNESYKQKYGVSRSKMNNDFLKGLAIKNILEVGCGGGNELLLLQTEGYKNLSGIDINKEAVNLTKKRLTKSTILTASALKIPFKDRSFDLVFTSGVLIHINPEDIEKTLREICRVSRKYIWGFEYYSPKCQMIEYRGHKNRLWKNDFVQQYFKFFHNLKVIKRKKFKYLKDKNIDEMFILEKI